METPTGKRSCVGRILQLEEEFGFTEKELKRAVRDVTRPREVKLPVFHCKTSKAEKIRQKTEKKASKHRRYVLAHWYLEVFLRPEEANTIYWEHLDFEELVQFAYEKAMGIIQLNTFVLDRNPDVNKMFPAKGLPDLEVPEIQEREFAEYCKTHPLKHGARDIFKRRKKFRKQRRRKRKRLYSKRRMRMYDPLFAATVVDEREMLHNLRRISAENERRCQKFDEMLQSLQKTNDIDPEVMAKFSQQTKTIMKRHERRMKDFMKAMGEKPAAIIFEMD